VVHIRQLVRDIYHQRVVRQFFSNLIDALSLLNMLDLLVHGSPCQ